jgi:F0F1-type ATP synthase gamma subunit
LHVRVAVKKRIKATANVAKLTGVMKMVASAKLKFVEERLNAGRPFGVRAAAAARLISVLVATLCV